MNLRQLVVRAGSALRKGWNEGGPEGSYRGPAWGESEFGNWFSIPFGDGYERGLEIAPRDARYIPAAYASVMANARAVSQCYATHKWVNPATGKHEIVTTSPASRILRAPNSYETWPQFILASVAGMQFDGEAHALATRDSRGAVTSLHRTPRRGATPHVEPDSQEIFYYVGDSDLMPRTAQYVVPQRDVLHLRQYCPRHPLIGESSIKAAALAAGINVALSRSQAAFFARMNRPSGVLTTDQPLTGVQMQQMREIFDAQSKSWAQGGMPILSRGLKFSAVSLNSTDAQLIQAQRLSIEDIARVYGVPLPVIGDLTHATLSNVEQLISMWLSISLGALLECIERSLDRLFNLPGYEAGEYIELDVTALLRTDFLQRVDGLTKGIQGGLYTPNEAREREGLPPVDAGDKPYLQQQMVPMGTLPAPAPPPFARAPAQEDPSQAANDDQGDDTVSEADQQKLHRLLERKEVVA